jgi:ribosome maturation factor RimP
MRLSPVEQQLDDLTRPTIDDMGFEIVRIRLRDIMGRRTLQYMIERKDGAALHVDDCSDVSHAVSALLDVEDPIEGMYDLEVSSPGIDRPLTRKKDFESFAGLEIKLETVMPINGRKRYRGKLVGVDGENTIVNVDGTDYSIPLDKVGDAKLVLNDELIKAYQARPTAIEDGVDDTEIEDDN